MNPTRLLAFVLAGSVVVPPLVRAQEAATRPAEPVAVQQPSPANVLVQRVREAQDPSSAIQAYADARAVAPTDLEVQRAYVHRMSEFGLPEMANQQAQDLLTRAPDDGVAWAVVGYLAAKRDQMDSAATDLSSAAQLAPDNPFVQRACAQIVAWADSRKDKTEVSPQALVAVGNIRNKLNGKPEFAQSYQGALSAYQRIAMAPAATAQPPVTTPSEPATQAPGDDTLLGPSSYYPSPAVSGYEQPIYPQPYYYTPSYYAEPYWYPSGFYGGYWWWPTASSFVFINDDFHNHFNHHDHDFNDFHHHHGEADFRDPHFFDHGGAFDHHGQSGHFGDWTDPQRHFAMAPLDHSSRMTAVPQSDGRAFRSADPGRSFSGIRTSPSMAPSRVVAPTVQSPSLMPSRVFSPGVRGGSPGIVAVPQEHGGGGRIEGHAQPAGAAMSPGEHWSGGSVGSHGDGGGGGGGRGGMSGGGGGMSGGGGGGGFHR